MASLLIVSRGWSSSPRRAAIRCCDAGRRFLAARAGGVVEMANVIDRYNPKLGVLKAWTSWSASTLAVVRLGSTLPGWTVPKFKLEAAQLYIDVGAALAAGSESKLRNLVTPSCLPALLQSIRAPPKGQRHTWETRNVQASIRHVRIGHHASNPGRQFAQITCSIDAQVVWRSPTSARARVSAALAAQRRRTRPRATCGSLSAASQSLARASPHGGSRRRWARCKMLLAASPRRDLYRLCIHAVRPPGFLPIGGDGAGAAPDRSCAGYPIEYIESIKLYNVQDHVLVDRLFVLEHLVGALLTLLAALPLYNSYIRWWRSLDADDDIARKAGKKVFLK